MENNNERIFRVPATMSKYQSMAHRAMRLTFDTQENLTDTEVSRITSYHDKLCYLVILYEKACENELIKAVNELPELEYTKTNKSPSQRLRSVIYVYWQQKGSKGDFQLFYENIIEDVINKFKDKLI